MATAPLVATVTSILALGLTAALARLVRQERQRSDARVSMLVAMANEPAGALPAATPSMLPPPVRLERRPVPTAADVEIRRAAPVPIAALAAPAITAPDLFEPAAPRSGHALVYVFAAAVIMAALIAFAFRWAVSSSGAPQAETTQAIAAPVAEPLALVSLSHEQHADGTLVISGVVRNPLGSPARERLFAAASLVDAAGVLIASGRAPLDFTKLGPGDESPFVVRVAGAAGVVRYRVGFRDADGVSVGHVDKR